MDLTKLTSELCMQAKAERCRRDFFVFVKTFWDVIIQEEPIYNWHIPYLCEELQKLADYIVNRQEKPYDLIINIPPGTSKSTIVTIMFPAWIWTIAPWVRIITNSYSGALSIEHSIKSKDIVESDKYKRLFPYVEIRADKGGKQHYETTEGGFRYATSTGATITGMHAHVIINDDPENPRQADSEQMRHIANEHTKTLSSRKVDKRNTPIITIMQRLHTEDVTGYILKKKSEKIRHICLPAELCDNVKPSELKERYIDGLLDPIRLNRQVLEESKTDLGSMTYAGQFQQQPSTEGGNIIKRGWIKTIKECDFWAKYNNEPKHFFLDTAYREKGDGNDPSGILCACMVQGNIYITKAVDVYKEMPDLLRFIPQFMQANGADGRSTLRVEPKANGISVVQMLRTIGKINVCETRVPTESKVARLMAKSPRFECGRVYIVEGDWNEHYLYELENFPKAEHDELVDVSVYALDFFFREENKVDIGRFFSF